jgi:hypothetical protein
MKREREVRRERSEVGRSRKRAVIGEIGIERERAVQEGGRGRKL